MKLQHLAIIFVIIILPISMVISEYIESQIDTISLQTQYSSKLHTATHDAIKAFQLNSINNAYSSISILSKEVKITNLKIASLESGSLHSILIGDKTLINILKWVNWVVLSFYGNGISFSVIKPILYGGCNKWQK